MAKLRLLTLTWQAVDKLTRLKNSLLPALSGLDWEWVVKSNGCTDGTIERVEKWGNKVKLIKYPNNLQNFSQGINTCFNEANPDDNDMILLLNNDIVFNDTTSIKEMISLLKDDIGVVGARLLYTNTKRLQHAGVIFDPFYKFPTHFRQGQLSDPNAERNRLFQVVTGAVLLLRASDFRNIFKNRSGTSGMDENFHWAFDDVDLCLSVRYNMGKKVAYCGKTNIFHEESASLKKNPLNKMFLPHNLTYLTQKWGGKYTLDRSLYERDPNYNVLE